MMAVYLNSLSEFNEFKLTQLGVFSVEIELKLNWYRGWKEVEYFQILHLIDPWD